jgi:hypothetical protein
LVGASPHRRVSGAFKANFVWATPARTKSSSCHGRPVALSAKPDHPGRQRFDLYETVAAERSSVLIEALRNAHRWLDQLLASIPVRTPFIEIIQLRSVASSAHH